MHQRPGEGPGPFSRVLRRSTVEWLGIESRLMLSLNRNRGTNKKHDHAHLFSPFTSGSIQPQAKPLLWIPGMRPVLGYPRVNLGILMLGRAGGGLLGVLRLVVGGMNIRLRLARKTIPVKAAGIHGTSRLRTASNQHRVHTCITIPLSQDSS